MGTLRISQLSGQGLVLFECEDGTTRTAELAPRKVTYIAPFWAHRLGVIRSIC